MDYIFNLSDQFFIDFTKETLPPLLNVCGKDYTQEYQLKTLKDYKKCIMRVYYKGSFYASGWIVFRDYTATVFANRRSLLNQNNSCSFKWRKKVLSVIQDKQGYAKEFNAVVEEELKDLEEDYKFKKSNLQSLKLEIEPEME